MAVSVTFLNARESSVPDQATLEVDGVDTRTLVRQYRATVQLLYEGNSASILTGVLQNQIGIQSAAKNPGALFARENASIPVTDTVDYLLDAHLNYPPDLEGKLIYSISEVSTNYDKTNHDIMTVVGTIDIMGPYEKLSGFDEESSEVSFEIIQPITFSL